jgi:hypothetical protein
MGIELIYPTINLFQYNLRQGLGDNDAQILARSTGFYRKFLPEDKDLQIYRDRELPDREFNELLKSSSSASNYQPLGSGLDGFYCPVQLGDVYALQLNYSGKLIGGKPDLQPQALNTAIVNLKNYLEQSKLLPQLDGGSFGQTFLVTAFVDRTQTTALADIAKDCDEQITGESPKSLARVRKDGHWMGGKIFEFWTAPPSYQGNLQDIVNRHPHVIVWLFPVDKLAEINKKIIPDSYQHWMRLFHYRHKIFYAYYQSQFIKEKLKVANATICQISDRLKSSNSSLPQLQYLLFDNLQESQAYSDSAQSLADQQHTIAVDRENYRLRHDTMSKDNAHSNLQFLLEFDTKYASKYERQIIADRAHLDSGLMMLERLAQAIQTTIQIEQTKSDRTTNVLIASVGSGLAISQVVCSILVSQYQPAKSINFYETYAFQSSLISGAIPIVLIMGVYSIWGKLRK